MMNYKISPVTNLNKYLHYDNYKNATFLLPSILLTWPIPFNRLILGQYTAR